MTSAMLIYVYPTHPVAHMLPRGALRATEYSTLNIHVTLGTTGTTGGHMTQSPQEKNIPPYKDSNPWLSSVSKLTYNCAMRAKLLFSLRTHINTFVPILGYHLASQHSWISVCYHTRLGWISNTPPHADPRRWEACFWNRILPRGFVNMSAGLS